LAVSKQVDGGVPTALALLVAGTFFMEILDGTIVATAAPSMARSFGVQSSQIGVCVTAYLLILAMLIPSSGWLADRIGARRTFLSAIIVFTVASALCAASTTLPELTIMRVVQGIGGAMMVPVGRLVVLRAVGKQDMIRAIAYLTWPALVAPMVAPAAGGLLSTYASWHWIFLINLPLGAIAAVVALRVMPATVPVRGQRLDWAGFAGSAVSLCCLVSGSALLGESRLQWLPIVVLTVVGIGVGSASVRHLLRAAHPLLDLGVLRVRTFRIAHAGGSLFRAAVNAVPFLLPLLFQDRFGWSAAKAGGVVLFVFVGNLAIKPLTTPMLHRLGFRTVLIVATGCACLLVAACALITATTPVAVIALVVMLGGAFRSIGFTAYNTIAFADVDQPSMNAANTLAATIQQLAQGLGIAVAVVALRLGTAAFSSADAYRFAFVLVAAMIAVALVEAIALPHSAGDALRAAPGSRTSAVSTPRGR
jgi:EmrB/QacA subfamily drug resistance transporter